MQGTLQRRMSSPTVEQRMQPIIFKQHPLLPSILRMPYESETQGCKHKKGLRRSSDPDYTNLLVGKLMHRWVGNNIWSQGSCVYFCISHLSQSFPYFSHSAFRPSQGGQVEAALGRSLSTTAGQQGLWGEWRGRPKQQCTTLGMKLDSSTAGLAFFQNNLSHLPPLPPHQSGRGPFTAERDG